MISLYDAPVSLAGGVPISSARDGGDASGSADSGAADIGAADIGCGTMTRQILDAHNHGRDTGKYRIKFDALISHDITYVGIIQTARASGMTRFPLPYALTNCHNSLCAVGGTINEDDHAFGLSAAKKYGGAYVPANLAVIHQYARETMCVAGGMILGSDSHTRYGALGVLGVGEGGPELVKQLLGDTYDITAPEVVLVWLENAPPPGVGPHDVAIALCGAVYKNGFVKNKALEFAGPGLAALPMDFRFGIDVMTTETACLTSIWRTDDRAVSDFYIKHGRGSNYKPLAPCEGASYGSMIKIDLSLVKPMIAMPFHPSNAYTIEEANANAADILRETEREAERQFGPKISFALTDKVQNGKIRVDQGIIAGCAGGMYDNIREAAKILDGASIGDGLFSLSIYPSSAPVNLALIEDGVQSALIRSGALFKPCFCGPCFGAGDVPNNNGLSVRHTTRNFMNREGSKPGDGQLAAVALTDARSIAATARNGGLLTAAADIENYGASSFTGHAYELSEAGNSSLSNAVAPPDFGSRGGACDRAESEYYGGIYEKRVYNGYGRPDPGARLVFGPNIADWPVFDPLGDNLLLRLASVIHDEVTTTDELIPSGEASSYRSNPRKLASFTLSRRDPQYIARAGATQALEDARKRQIAINDKTGANLPSGLNAQVADSTPSAPAAAKINALTSLTKAVRALETALSSQIDMNDTQIASAIFARKPGDGSAREQAASCQRVLGGGANICHEYATKRYRSNLINWGLLPFVIGPSYASAAPADFSAAPDDWIYVPDIRKILLDGRADLLNIPAYLIYQNSGGEYDVNPLTLQLGALTGEEREIILAGCLMNFYANKHKS